MRLKGHQSMKLSIDHNLHKRANQESKNLSNNNVSRKKGCHKRRSTLKIAQQNIIQRFNRKQWSNKKKILMMDRFRQLVVQGVENEISQRRRIRQICSIALWGRWQDQISQLPQLPKRIRKDKLRKKKEASTLIRGIKTRLAHIPKAINSSRTKNKATNNSTKRLHLIIKRKRIRIKLIRKRDKVIKLRRLRHSIRKSKEHKLILAHYSHLKLKKYKVAAQVITRRKRRERDPQKLKVKCKKLKLEANNLILR